MIRRPPRSTRTDTLLPYTTLFRSLVVEKNARLGGASAGYDIAPGFRAPRFAHLLPALPVRLERELDLAAHGLAYARRSEEHTSELQSLMRISYAVFCLKKKKTNTIQTTNGRRSIHKKKQH